MKFSIATLLLAVTGVSYVLSQQCHLREVDLCVTTVVFHFQSSGVPSDEEKVDEWCEDVALRPWIKALPRIQEGDKPANKSEMSLRTVTEVRDCMGNFTEKCMSPLQRELAQLLSGGVSSAERQLCTPGSELRSNYLQHAQCLAEGAESESFKTDLRDLQATIETIFEVEFKKRLPTFCCGARRFHHSTEEHARRRCGEDAVDMLKLIMDMVFTELPKTICQSYDPEGDRCKELLPAPGTPPKGAESKSQISKLLDTVISNL